MNLKKQEYETFLFKLREPWNMQVYVCVCTPLCVYVCVYSVAHSVLLQLI